MSKLVQLITVKIVDDHDHAEAMANLKKMKEGLAPHGIDVAAHMAIEAGPASGHAVISLAFPSAAKWAEMVDSDNEHLKNLRKKMLENNANIVSTSLLQEVEL